MKPAISVIIGLYNKRPYIARAVQSVLAQTLGSFELIIVDDGSTDGGAEELLAFRQDPRLRLIQQSNAGECAARNRGLAEMHTELAAFLDADDAFLPEHLEGLERLAQMYPSAGLLGTAYYNIFPDGRHIVRVIDGPRQRLLEDYFTVSRRCGFLPMNASSVAVRRATVEQVGGFREGVAIGGDVEYWARIALEMPVAYDATPSALYYLWNPASAMAEYRWNPAPPQVVATLHNALRNRPDTSDRERSAIDYAAWILLKHAACGIAESNRQGARSLLNHELLSKCNLQGKRALLWAATCAPDALLRTYLKMRNRHWERTKKAGLAGVTAGSAQLAGSSGAS